MEPGAILSGVRVLDLATDVAGAFAAKLLATFGAEVVKVEAPSGDPTRWLPPRAAGDSPDAGVLFAALNAGKRGLVADPEYRGDLAVLAQLLDRSQIVIESGAPGEWLERGLDLSGVPASTVVCSITPFGQDGPRAGWRATALTAFAAGGQMSLFGEPDRPPIVTAGHQAHLQAGLHAFAATLTALFAAERTGIGDHIDISIQEAQAASLEGAGPAALVRGTDQERMGNGMRATWGIHPCADGWVGLAAMARQMDAVYRCIGRDDLLDRPEFMQTLRDADTDAAVREAIQEWTKTRTAQQIFDESQAHRGPFGLIPRPGELLAWTTLHENGFWCDVDHPVLGPHTLPGAPLTVNDERAPERRAPLLGEHTREIQAELDADDARDEEPTDDFADATDPRPLLDGIRVLDLTQVWAGPFATRLLADMGADVIHIEGPAFPDVIRGLTRPDEPRAFDRSSYFNEYNRNKRGLVLDLRTAEGMRAFERLVATADVVIENWSVGVAGRLGLGYEALRALNPRVVFVQMPAFGVDGPEASRMGFGPTIEQMGGLVALQGYEGGPPQKSGTSYGDPTGGTMAAAGVALGLVRRERTGDGCHIVVSQRDNVIGLASEFMVAASLDTPAPARVGNRHEQWSPHNVYRTRDDEGRVQTDIAGNPVREFDETWLAIAVDSDEAWWGLRGVVGDDRLGRDDYATAAGRLAASAEIDAVIGEWARKQDATAAARRLQEAGVSASPVLTPLMIARDAHLEAREFFTTYDHPEAGHQRTTRPVWRLAARPVEGVRPAPCFGEHNAEVLREVAGYDEAAIAALAAAGVIATEPR